MNINENGINRPMTPEELAQLEIWRAEYVSDVANDRIVNPPDANEA